MKLRFVVGDQLPCAGKAVARIVVRSVRGRTVKALKRVVTTGVTSSASFRCKLAKGTYRFTVYASDAAGNLQSVAGANRLTVR